MTRLALVGVLVSAALSTAVAAEKVSVRLGGVTISYDPAHWVVADPVIQPTIVVGGKEVPAVQHITCIAPDCRDRPLVAAFVKSESSATGPCAGATGGDGRGDSHPMAILSPERDRSGLGLAVRMFTGMCRARSPVMLSACGRKDGLVYSFNTGLSLGCGGVEGAPDALFGELLAGIAPASD